MYALGTQREIKRGIAVVVERQISRSTDCYDRDYWLSRIAPFEQVKATLDRCRFVGKWLRPWDCVAPATVLDPEKVWVGVEVETGYTYIDDRTEAIRWFNNTIKRGCYDEEGPARGVEFTFYPTHLEDLEYKSQVIKLLRRARAHPPVEHESCDQVGTHMNISTPGSRAGRDVLQSLYLDSCAFDDALDYDERETLFGRGNLYQYEPNYMGEGYYEFKWFNTTYDIRQWLVYCLVARKLAEMIQTLENTRLRGDTGTNFFFAGLRSLLPEARRLLNLKKGYKYAPRNKKEPVQCVLL